MAINQNDKVIRQIMVGDKQHEICSKYLGGYTYDEIHQEIQDSVGSGIQDLALTPLKNVTYYDLVNLRNNGLLVPGQSYRIIDYATTTTQENTKSAKHNFDIIVKALNNNTLSENASVCRCFNSKRDHGVEINSDIFNYTDENDWYNYGHAYGGPTLPDDVLKLKNEANIDVVSTDYGKIQISDVEQYLNKIFRITLQGTDVNENKIRGFGATLIKNGVIQDFDFGFRDEFYLRLPESATTGEYVLRFYAVGKESDMNSGYAGARAESFDPTSHFNDSDLNAWEIKYSLDNDTNRFAWADAVNGKGVIYYMKDEFNNECWYDFKNIQFNCVVKQTHNSQEVEFRPDGYEYAYTFTDFDGNDLSLTPNARNNSIKKYTTSGNGLQTLNNTSFICSAVHNNNIEENSYSNVFYVNSCYYNTIGRAFQNNFISAPTGTDRTSIHNNIIGNLFKSNRIQSTFNRNVIGNTTTSCDFYSTFSFNEIGNYSYNIDFNYPISFCKFGSYIQYCVFNNTAAYQPSASEMIWCTIGDGLEGAQYIPCCQKVTFENRALYNTSSNFHINDVVLNDGTKLVEQLVQQHEDQLYVCSVDGGCAVFRYKNTVSEINLGTFDSINSVSSKASEIDICSNQNITRMSFKIDNDSRKYANGFIEQFISGGPYSINSVEHYYIVQTLYFDGLTQSRQIIYTINDSVKNVKNVGGWLKIIDHDNSNTESPILYSRSSEVVNIASAQTITGSKRFDSDINLAGKTIIKNGSNIDNGELKVFKANDSGAGFTIRTNGKFSNNVPVLEILATNNNEAYKYQFPQLANTIDPDYVVVKSQLDEVIEDEKKYVYIEWGELMSLKNNDELKPGCKYRITDYVTTTSQPNTQSAGHQFDIIVEALSENTLNEDAKAIQNENDGYFDEFNLEAWEIKYCLDNDTNRFAWAVESKTIITGNCRIKPELINGNVFIEPFTFDGRMLNDNKEIAYEGSDKGDLIYEWGYETEPNGDDSLYIIKNGEGYENEGMDYNDKHYYRGTINIDGETYDMWEKYEFEEDYYYIQEENGGVYFLTKSIVDISGSSEITIGGKGVIYYMKDEFDNECPYDFKNIKFKRTKQWVDDNNLRESNDELNFSETEKYFYTFDWNGTDDSLCKGNYKCEQNKIEKLLSGKQQQLNDNIFLGNGNANNKIGANSKNNVIGVNTYNNEFGVNFQNNIILKNFTYNSVGNDFKNNIIRSIFRYNNIGHLVSDNEFKFSFNSNIVRENVKYNTFNGTVEYNTIGAVVQNNLFNDVIYYSNIGTNLTYCSLVPGLYRVTIDNAIFQGTENSPIDLSNILVDNKPLIDEIVNKKENGNWSNEGIMVFKGNDEKYHIGGETTVKYAKEVSIDGGANLEVEAQLSPNIYYNIENAGLANIIFVNSVSGEMNNYMFQISVSTSENVPTPIINLPNDIKWANGKVPTFKSGKTYQISVINKLGVFTEY